MGQSPRFTPYGGGTSSPALYGMALLAESRIVSVSASLYFSTQPATLSVQFTSQSRLEAARAFLALEPDRAIELLESDFKKKVLLESHVSSHAERSQRRVDRKEASQTLSSCESASRQATATDVRLTSDSICQKAPNVPLP